MLNGGEDEWWADHSTSSRRLCYETMKVDVDVVALVIIRSDEGRRRAVIVFVAVVIMRNDHSTSSRCRCCSSHPTK